MGLRNVHHPVGLTQKPCGNLPFRFLKLHSAFHKEKGKFFSIYCFIDDVKTHLFEQWIHNSPVSGSTRIGAVNLGPRGDAFKFFKKPILFKGLMN